MGEMQADYPLARYGGSPPPRSPWLEAALAHAPERGSFDCVGAGIELLTWGKRGLPGLLFLHGNGGHADWWSFIAPHFAQGRRCAAISWAGMGRSGWREAYSVERYVDELLGAIAAAGLDVAGPPLVIGHSFGGIPLIHAAANQPDRIAGGILVDSFVPPPERKTPGWVVSGRAPPRYASEAEIIMRYRFAPPQDSPHPDIVDFLARRSVRQDPDSGEWAWCFDPRMWATVDRTAADRFVEQVRIPMGLIRGEDSALVSRGHLEAMAERLPDCRFVTEVPGARHHVMVDQPQALVTALVAGIAELEKNR